MYSSLTNEFPEKNHGTPERLLSFIDVPREDTEQTLIPSHSSSNANETFQDYPREHRDRANWRSLLYSVLRSDVYKTEKRRLSNTIQLDSQRMYNMWLEIRALIAGRARSAQETYLDQARLQINPVLDEVLNFEVRQNSQLSPFDQVTYILNKVDTVESFYPSTKMLKEKKVVYASPSFQYNLDVLTSWWKVTKSLKTHLEIVRSWTGVGTPTNTEDNTTLESGNAFRERVLKETDLEKTFKNGIIVSLSPVLMKAKQLVLEHKDALTKMKLPLYVDDFQQLKSFPIKLLCEYLKLRILYVDMLKEANAFFFEETLDEVCLILSFAATFKKDYQNFKLDLPEEESTDAVEEEYESLLLESLNVYLKLITFKITTSTKARLDSTDFLLNEWNALRKQYYVADGGHIIAATHICTVANDLLRSVKTYFFSQMILPEEKSVDWYDRVLDNVRTKSRKIIQFTTALFTDLNSATDFVIAASVSELVQVLYANRFSLILTDVYEDEGIFIFIHPKIGKNIKLIRSLVNCSIVEMEECGEAYLLILSTKEKLEWQGTTITISLDFQHMELAPNSLRLVADSSQRLPQYTQSVQRIFKDILSETDIVIRSPSLQVEKKLKRLRNTLYKFLVVVIDSVNQIKDLLNRPVEDSLDVIENFFTYSSSFGTKVLPFLNPSQQEAIMESLLLLGRDWVKFLCNECDPSDRKTFRWTLIALEFLTIVIRGDEIFRLSGDYFNELRSCVSWCVSILIPHFSVSGGGVSLDDTQMEQEKSYFTDSVNSLVQENSFLSHDPTQEFSFSSVRKDWILKLKILDEKRDSICREQRKIGKVLEAQTLEDQGLVCLASSSSNVSMRWQQGKYIGGGSYGNVYLAINLDIGQLMAVKKIQLLDPNTSKMLLKSVTEEMKVMEMLHNPNIVNYYGIEVHRDKIFIFMEYCHGGSLSRQLEYGKIEEETTIRVYTLQILRGLKYLHSQLIVHRDIKPDNILLDHQGVIKIVDFGASKILKQQKTNIVGLAAKTLTGTPMYMAPVITGQDYGMLGSQDVWSLGCCVLEMFTGKRPWANLDNEWAIMYHIGVASLHPPLPDPSQISSAGMDFLKQCFKRNPRERPSPSDLLNHEFVCNLSEEDITIVKRKQSVSIARIQDSYSSIAEHDSLHETDMEGVPSMST